MSAYAARTSRRIPRRLLGFGIILLLAAARAGTSDVDELGLTTDAITTAVSVDVGATSAPGDFSAHQSDGIPKQNHTVSAPGGDSQVTMCPSGLQCSKLGGECINCSFNFSCVYGEEVLVWCSAKRQINCTYNAPFQVSMVCRYCYQVEPWEQSCQPFDRQRQCKAGNTQREKERYRTNCTAKSNVVCLGLRIFPRYLACNWTAGYKWTTALVLSITLGGFGADRFYLGHWQEGIGKLFSFGGLGVWTLLDVILIAVGYLGPADGSLYIW